MTTIKNNQLRPITDKIYSTRLSYKHVKPLAAYYLYPTVQPQTWEQFLEDLAYEYFYPEEL